MPRRIISAISRMNRDSRTPVPGAEVHFHPGSDGRLYVRGRALHLAGPRRRGPLTRSGGQA
jgi:hypothetical protein